MKDGTQRGRGGGRGGADGTRGGGRGSTDGTRGGADGTRGGGPLDPELVRIHPGIKRYLAVCTVSAALATLLTVAQALLLAQLLADLFAAGASRALASFPLPLAAGVVAGRCALAWWDRWYPATAAAEVKRTLRAGLTEAAGRGRIRGTGPPTADVVALLTRGGDALDGYVAGTVSVLPHALVVPPAVVGTLLFLDLPSGLTVLATLPFVPLLLALVGMHTKARTERQWALLLRLGGHFLQAVSGLATLRVFGRQDDAARRIRSVSAEHRVVTMATLRQAFLSSFVLETMTTLAVALIAVPVGFRLLSGSMELSAGLAVLLLTPEAYRPLRTLSTRFHASQDGKTVLAQARRIREASPAPAEPSSPRLPGAPDPAGVPIVLDRLTVGFSAAAPALTELSLVLEPGRCHALTGPSGAGKTTLLRTLAGLLPPLGGQIRVGGTPLSPVPGDAWTAHLGVVPQRPHLFATSLADNVRLGRPDATDAEVERALEEAGATGFVHALPDGTATRLGDGGLQLSAGERQRVALARALLRRPALLLLDEPTARLDGETEHQILAALRALPSTTSLVVTHRPRVMEYADTVIRIGDTTPQPRPALEGRSVR